MTDKISRPAKSAECLWCGKIFGNHRHAQVYCTRLCRDRAKIGWRFVVLARDKHACLYCTHVKKKDARPLRPNFLYIARVKPNEMGTAGNVATVCKFCFGEWTGLSLPESSQAHVLAAVSEANGKAGIEDDLVVEGADWATLHGAGVRRPAE